MLVKAVKGRGDLELLNWSYSVFWALVGTVSVAACVSSTNKRLRAEAERLKLQEQRVALLERAVRLQAQKQRQDEQLRQVEDLLTNSGHSWWGGSRLPYPDLLAVLGNKGGTSG